MFLNNILIKQVAQTAKNPPVLHETWVRSLSQEDPLGEGNGNPLQYSYLENPMEREVWQATVYGVVRVGHYLTTKPPPVLALLRRLEF